MNQLTYADNFEKLKRLNPLSVNIFRVFFLLFLVLFNDPLGIGLKEGRARYLIVIIIGSFLLLFFLARKRAPLTLDKKVFWLALSLFVWMIVSAVMSLDPMKSFPNIIGIMFVYWISAIIIPRIYSNNYFLKNAAMAFVYYNVIFGLISILSIRDSTTGYLQSSVVDVNPGNYASLIILFVLVRFWSKKYILKRIVKVIVITFLFYLVLTSGSKGIVFNSSAYIIFFSSVYSKKLFYLLGGLAVLCLAAFIAEPQLNISLQELAPKYKRGQYMEFSTGRIERFKYQIEVFKLNPLFGTGFSQPERRLEGPSASMRFRAGSHNSYLTFLAETGMIGGLLFLAISIYVFMTIYRYLSNVKIIDSNNWYIVFWSIFIAGLLVNSFFEGTLSGLGYGGLIYWTVMPNLNFHLRRNLYFITTS